MANALPLGGGLWLSTGQLDSLSLLVHSRSLMLYGCTQLQRVRLGGGNQRGHHSLRIEHPARTYLYPPALKDSPHSSAALSPALAPPAPPAPPPPPLLPGVVETLEKTAASGSRRHASMAGDCPPLWAQIASA